MTEKQRIARVQQVMAEEEKEPRRWWWLFFTEDGGAFHGSFRGVAAVYASGLMAAIQEAHRHEINPGPGSRVEGYVSPDHDLPKEKYRYCFVRPDPEYNELERYSFYSRRAKDELNELSERKGIPDATWIQ